MFLQNKNLKAGDIVSLKLVTGEEVFAKLVSDEGMSYEIAKPFSVINTGGPNGVIITAFCLTGDKADSYPVNKNTVITITKSSQQFVDEYTKLTSPIKKPTAADAQLIKGLSETH